MKKITKQNKVFEAEEASSSQSKAGIAKLRAKAAAEQLTLFPNKNPMPETYIQVKRESSDYISSLFQSDKASIQSAKISEGFQAKLTKRTSGDVQMIIDGKFKTREAFEAEVLTRRKAKFILTHMALQAFCYDRQSFDLTNVKLTDLMKYRYKIPKSGYFTDKKQKQDFTQSLLEYAATKIAVDIQAPKLDSNGKPIKRRGKPIMENQTAFVQLMNIERAIFAKKNTDKTVAVRLFGKLNPQLISNSRGRFLPRYILELNPAYNRREIGLAFYLTNRADQLRQGIERNKKKEGVPDVIQFSVSRGQLIRAALMSDTEAANPRQATKRLTQSLEKLKGKVIVDYSKFGTHDSDERINIKAFTDIPVD